MEHDEQADRLEREAAEMEEHSDRVGERIDATRRDWAAKEDDPAVPGARAEPGSEDEEDDGDEEGS